MQETISIVLKILISCLVTYFVYKDSRAKDVPYHNFWVVGTMLLPPVALLYLIYRKMHEHRVVLTKKQQVNLARQKQVEARKKELDAERREYVKREAQQTLEEKEAAQQLRQKQRDALAWEREQKEALNAQRLKVKI